MALNLNYQALDIQYLAHNRYTPNPNTWKL